MSDPARPIVIASNRGPISFEIGDGRELEERRGAGGLVTALTGALSATGGLWISAAMGEGDRLMAERSPDGHIEVVNEDTKYHVRYLAIAEDAFDRYYNVVANRILWFVHHYLFDVVRSPRFGPGSSRAWRDYVDVNETFAEALAAEERPGGRSPGFLVQDYHLALVPAMLRRRRPHARIAHFSHTPFAGPGYFQILPGEMGRAILTGMLGADVLGFHSQAWSDNFLLCCRNLEGARVNLRSRWVEYRGRRTLVRDYPIAIDTEGLRRSASGPEFRRTRRELTRWRGEAKLVVRVDRTELSKNILRGFLAFEALLRREPAWRGRVRFLALLNPSRRAIPEYRAYTRECLRAAERINRELGAQGWKPVEVVIADDYPRVIAAYSLYDVLLVNPVFDGMNLVALEGPTLNRNAGALILSRNAGAAALLGRHALLVNPFDVGETADALHAALTMPEAERARRARAVRRIVRGNRPSRWVQSQLDDLERAAEGR
jgi:trehalose 6-phosphate synthase